MSPWAEIDAVVGQLLQAKRDLAVMQCTSRYPTTLEDVGLNVIDELRQRYGVPAGLSDHSGRTAPALAAIARGADLIEFHITLDRGMFGPDVPASLTVEEVRAVVEFRDALAVMDRSPVDKDRMATSLATMRSLFGRSLAPARNLSAGTTLAADMLVAKKPGTGIAATALSKLVGRKLVRDVSPDRLLDWNDLEAGHEKT
jgi:N-acetylneuraminate synthase